MFISLLYFQQKISSLNPEELRERIDALDEYLGEIDAAIEPDEPEDLDDYLKEVDDLIAEEDNKGASALPSAPTTQVKSPSQTTDQKKVAELEWCVCQKTELLKMVFMPIVSCSYG